MKKLFVLISILSLLALPVAAQEPTPEPVYLPIILKGVEMPCGPYQELRIETLENDKIVGVNLLSPTSGFCLVDWQPALAEPKGGGVWRDSTLAEGRRLATRQRANAIDTLTLAVRDWTPDDLIRDTQDLRRLLEKAYAYGTTSWQDEPVWIKRHPVNATYPEYTIIYDYRTPQDGNPHGSDTFWTGLARAGFPEFVLILEHEGFWRADQPGTGTCVQASGERDWAPAGPWLLNTNQPVTAVTDFQYLPNIQRLLAADMFGPGPGTSGEIWRTDNGIAWNASAAPPAIDVYIYDLAAESDTVILAACRDTSGPVVGNIYRSINSGVNWGIRNAAWGATSNQSLIYRQSDGYYYLADGLTSNVGRSNDSGLNWASVLAIMNPNIFLTSQDTLLVGANGGIYRSVDGTTWRRVYAGNNFLGFAENASDGVIIAGDNARDLYISSDDGQTWVFIEAIGGAGLTGFGFEGGYFWAASNTLVYRGLPCGTVWKLEQTMGGGVNSFETYPPNGYVYMGESGDIFTRTGVYTFGQEATCDDETYITNKANIAQLTHVWEYEVGVGWTNHLPSGAFPFQLLPNPMSNGDAIVLTIDTSIVDSGPFDNAVFDVSTPAYGTYTLTWYYPSGGGAVFPPPGAGWTALNLHDGTVDFTFAGVNSLHFVPPSNWTQVAVNLITGYHIVGIISAVTGNPVGPQQDNRDVYTVNWPRVDVDNLQVPGDLPALLQVKLRNRSDEDGYESTIDELDTLENRVIVGLRSLDRGEYFTAYLNCSDEQNPIGVTATDGANTTDVNDIDHPTGRSMEHTTTGASTWTDECTFTIGPTVARDYYGSFHAYFRGQQEDWDTEIGEVRVRLQVRTGSGGVTFTTDHKPFRNLNDWQLLDFGGVDIPASGLFSSSDLADETELVIQIWSSVSSLTVNLYNLILIPTDEWALDAVDKALKENSGVTNGFYLDADSVTYPKRDIRALVRQVGSDRVRSEYQTNTPGPAILQANADQRLWFLTARGVVLGSHTGANNQTTLTDSSASFLTSGVAAGQVIFNVTDGSSGAVGATVTATTITDCGLAGGTDNDWDTNDEYIIICPNWRSEPWNAHSVQVVGNARYLSMRGAR